MRFLGRRAAVAVLTGFLAIPLAACGGEDTGVILDPCAVADLDTRLHLLAAGRGTLHPTDVYDDYVLRLENVLPDIVWYTDRPRRDSGEQSVLQFLQNTWPCLFEEVAPNAALQFQQAEKAALGGMFLELGAPEYDPGAGTLLFRARWLNSTLEEQPRNVLSMDNVVVTVLNNVREDSHASSFAQVASNASLEPAAVNGSYTLTLNHVDPDMFWMDNAPGRYSSMDTVTSFVEHWDERFGDTAPNASLYGGPDLDRMGLRLLTLSDPVYDEGDNRLTYTAVLLHQADGATPALDLAPATLLIDASGAAVHAVNYEASHYDNTNDNSLPSWSDMDQDFQVMAGHFDMVRTYSLNLNNGLREPRAAIRYGMRMAVGIGWGWNQDADNQQQLDLFQFIYGTYPELQSAVKYIIVGNEACEQSDEAAWKAWIDFYHQVRAWVHDNWTGAKPIMTLSERDGVWEAETAKDCGGYLRTHLPKGVPLFANIYPFWGNCTIQEATRGQADCSWLTKWHTLQSKITDREIIVGETGWPTDGSPGTDPATVTPTLSDARKYWKYIYGTFLPKNAGVKLFAFSAFDEPIKPSEGGSPDLAHYWGMYGTRREDKGGMTFPLNRTVKPAVDPGTYVNVVLIGSYGYDQVKTKITVKDVEQKKTYRYNQWHAASGVNAGYPWIRYHHTVQVHMPAVPGRAAADCSNVLVSGQGLDQDANQNLTWKSPNGGTEPCSMINWARNGIWLP